MAVGLATPRSADRVRVDPHDHHHAVVATQKHYWWHWRHPKQPLAVDEPAVDEPAARSHHAHHHRYHQQRSSLTSTALHRLHPTESVRPTHHLTKRMSSTLHDDTRSAGGRRKRIVLHAIFKC